LNAVSGSGSAGGGALEPTILRSTLGRSGAGDWAGE
jgi:hypothetical protein